MEELIFFYFINFIFAISVIKGFFKGASSGIVNIFFLILSFFLATMIFSASFKRVILSLVVFSATYNIGLFVSCFYQEGGLVQKILGALVGICHFFVFLTFTVCVALFMESVPTAAKSNFFIKIVLPYSESLKEKLSKI